MDGYVEIILKRHQEYDEKRLIINKKFNKIAEEFRACNSKFKFNEFHDDNILMWSISIGDKTVSVSIEDIEQYKGEHDNYYQALVKMLLDKFVW